MDHCSYKTPVIIYEYSVENVLFGGKVQKWGFSYTGKKKYDRIHRCKKKGLLTFGQCLLLYRLVENWI